MKKTKKNSFSKKNIYQGLAKYLKAYRGTLMIALLLSIGSNLLSLAAPKMLGKTIDAMAGSGTVDFPKVQFYGILLLACYVFSTFFAWRLALLLVRMSEKTIKRIEEDAFRSVLNLPLGRIEEKQKGDVVSLLSYDCSLIYEMLSSDFVSIVTGFFTIAGSFLMMLTISAKMAVLFLITIPLLIAVMRYVTSKSRSWYKERSVSMGELNTQIGDAVTGNFAIQAFHREKEVQKKLQEQSEVVASRYYRSASFSLMSAPIVNFINNSSQAVLAVFGAILYLRGAIGLGAISSFVLYSRRFTTQINETANQFSDLQSALASTERVFQLLSEEAEAETHDRTEALPEEQKKSFDETLQGDLRMKNVHFSYEPGCEVIRNFSMHASPGTMTAIVGPTGAGKTTLLNLFLRFYDAEEGEIFLNGRNVRDIPKRQLRRAFTVVQQDAWVFSGTVFENITYGNYASREQVIRAAKEAQLHEYIMTLPNGYDTKLSELGRSISRGQLQLLAIARALLSDAPFVILDEATSHVDSRTEKKLQRAFQVLMNGRTALVIAHRLSTLEQADQIIVLKEGMVAEQGIHAELMQSDGIYREMVECGNSNI